MTIPQALVKLSYSKFRRRFKLNDEMKARVQTLGLSDIRAFAVQRVEQFIAPSEPSNDGKQTPLKGHPVFLAQHATATCCRTCLSHWWRVRKGVALSESQITKIVNLIMAWIEMQMNGGVEQLKNRMSQEALAGIPYWRNQGKRFECPYQNKGRRVVSDRVR